MLILGSPRWRLLIICTAAVIFLLIFTSVTMKDRLPSLHIPMPQLPGVSKPPPPADTPKEDDAPPKEEPKPDPPKSDPPQDPPKVYKKPSQDDPAPVPDPFEWLQHHDPPPVPKWNMPKNNSYLDHGLPVAPALLVPFTRMWPVLLQCVVSYIAAGWPAEQIYVIENTGVLWANTKGKLTLQNPVYLNHTQLRMLGVNVVQTPVRLNFPQLQNFFLWLTHEKNWPYFFWTHSDSLAMSFEGGEEGFARYDSPDYKSLYEHALVALKDAREKDPTFATRFFAYDHLSLVNPVPFENMGGWDTMIPYYMSDCDMHARLLMDKYSMDNAKAGHVWDVNTIVKDLRVLYREPDAELKIIDPSLPNGHEQPTIAVGPKEDADPHMAYYNRLKETFGSMDRYKNEHGRNTWQASQRGGHGEPFYYPWNGFHEGINIMTQCGERVFAEKWGHQKCDIREKGRVPDDGWLLEHDWLV